MFWCYSVLKLTTSHVVAASGDVERSSAIAPQFREWHHYAPRITGASTPVNELAWPSARAVGSSDVLALPMLALPVSCGFASLGQLDFQWSPIHEFIAASFIEPKFYGSPVWALWISIKDSLFAPGTSLFEVYRAMRGMPFCRPAFA